MNIIPFNQPYMTGNELDYIAQAHSHGALAGDGAYTKLCQSFFQEYTGSNRVLLTHSCTAALEMAALLLSLGPEDEVVMPSYTFVSTANAFVLRGAVPVFVDIRPDTLNMDERLLGQAITSKTKCIVPVHYGGVACEMDEINAIARKYDIKIVEDAAQGVMAKYKGRALGTIGDLGAYSFHETKNIISGEGGALLVNVPEYESAAEIIWEKGTDRSRFFRGEVDKYSWQSVGSSFLPGEITAAFLYAQLEQAEAITAERLAIWGRYHDMLEQLEHEGYLKRPFVPEHCEHNAHMYYVVLSPHIDRQKILDKLKEKGVNALFHYVPLHQSPGGRRYGRVGSDMKVTEHLSQQVVRLPLWVGLTCDQQKYVVEQFDVILRASP